MASDPSIISSPFTLTLVLEKSLNWKSLIQLQPPAPIQPFQYFGNSKKNWTDELTHRFLSSFIVRSCREGIKYAQFCNSNSHFQNAFLCLFIILLKFCNQNDVIVKITNHWNDSRNMHYFKDVLVKQKTKLRAH